MTATSVLNTAPKQVQQILTKSINGERITTEEASILYYEAEIGLLASVANNIRERLHGNKTFFNRNFHIEPTNKCVFDCKFCSYSRNFQPDDASWELTKEQMLDIVRKYVGSDATEVHIVGGVHPKMNLQFFADLVKSIREIHPGIHIKGFTAVELEYMFRKAKVSIREGLEILQQNGLQSLPGGGAEIFDDEIRNQICKDKANAAEWLEIHETAHQLGMHSNCTMLYGHIEKYEHRIDHMNRLRELQDRTNGFNCFIPLKFRNQDNEMSYLPEVAIQEDLRVYAISRIFMDNIPHLKAYWPMIGRNTAQLLLNFGVDDLDGTIDDSTKIYSMAGSEEQNPALSTKDLVRLIKQVNRTPIERDSLYNELKDYSNYTFHDEPIVQHYH
jgi:aminodeoxyfutalosine synthase